MSLFSFGKRPAAERRPKIRLGTYGTKLRPFSLDVDLATFHNHAIVSGKSGYGKSRFLAGLFISLLQAGQRVTVIDPHGQLSDLLMDWLIADGYFRSARAFEKVIFLEVAQAEAAGRYLPLNILKRDAPVHVITADAHDAMLRAFPELGTAAATFSTLLPDAARVLASNDRPLTDLDVLLLQPAVRALWLQNESNAKVRSWFTDVYNQYRPREQADYAGSVLRRARNLSDQPVTERALSLPENILESPAIKERQASVILNLGGLPSKVRRLFGCIWTVAAEQAALALATRPPAAHPPKMVLAIDEFHEFIDQSEAQFTSMLSQTRKFGLHLLLAHQDFSQISERMKGSLLNVDVRVVFKLERPDAEYSALMLGRVNPYAVKHEVADAAALDRTHPMFLSANEQWETWIQAITDLKQQEAFIKLPAGSVHKFKTLRVPDPVVDPVERAAVRQRYLETYFRRPSAHPDEPKSQDPCSPGMPTDIELDDEGYEGPLAGS